MLVSVFGVAFWWVLTVMWVCWVGGGLVYVFAGKIAGFCGILLGGCCAPEGFWCGVWWVWVRWVARNLGCVKLGLCGVAGVGLRYGMGVKV